MLGIVTVHVSHCENGNCVLQADLVNGNFSSCITHKKIHLMVCPSHNVKKCAESESVNPNILIKSGGQSDHVDGSIM